MVRVIVGGEVDVVKVIVGGEVDEVVAEPVKVVEVEEGGSVELGVSDGEGLDHKDVPDVPVLLLPLSIDDTATACLG